MQKQTLSTKALLLALMVGSATAFSATGYEKRNVRTVGARIRSANQKNRFLGQAKQSRVGWLQYRSGDEGLSQPTLPSVSKTRTEESDTNGAWWKTLFPSVAAVDVAANKQDEISQMAEEYLKFLDKRYNQIREADPALQTKQQKQQAPQFLGWLNKEESPKDDDSSARTAEASESDAAESTSVGPRIVSLKQIVLYARIVRARSAFLKYKATFYAQLGAVVLNALKRLPQLPSFLMKAGGGKQPTTVALSIVAVVVFQLILPAISMIVRDTLQA